MGVQLREGVVSWTRDLNASTSTTAFPTASTAGVAIPSTLQPGGAGTRVHVAVNHAVASGTVSLFVGLYGYSAVGDLSAGSWYFLGALNNAAAMAADGSKWSPDLSTIAVAEVFTVSGANYTRFATRQIAPGGSSPLTTTYIGFPVE